MRFTLSSTALYARLQTLSKVISNKNSLPILESFLFEVTGGQVYITASDGENVMKSALSLDDTAGDGIFAVPCRTMLDAMKELPEQPITFDVNNDTLEVGIDYQGGEYRFNAQNADEYPRTEEQSEGMSVVTIDAGVLVDNINRTMFATDNNEIRPVMNGIYFDLTPDCLAFVASDGHKLVRSRYYAIKSDTPASFILPKKPATLLKNSLNRDSGDVVVKFGQRTAEIHFADGTLTCRLIEGNFPNYNAAIPNDNPNELLVDRKALGSALRRVLPFASMSSQLVRFKLSQGMVELSSEDIDFATSAKERIICDYGGQAMQIGFRGDFLLEILNTLDTTDVRFMLGDPSRAGVVLPAEQPENTDVLMLIMPLLLND